MVQVLTAAQAAPYLAALLEMAATSLSATAGTAATAATIGTAATAATIGTAATVATAATIGTAATVATAATIGTAATVATVGTAATVATAATIGTAATVATVATAATATTAATVGTVVATTVTTTALSTILLPATLIVGGLTAVGLGITYFYNSSKNPSSKPKSVPKENTKNILKSSCEYTTTKQETQIPLNQHKEEQEPNDNTELHLPWVGLSSYRGKTKKGLTNKKNLYYYEKDYLHGDVQVYRKVGSKGIHRGSVSMAGGPLTKPPVYGRTITL